MRELRKMERESIVFYRSFAEALNMLDAEDFKEAVTGILNYGLDGEIPEFKSVMADIIFTMAKPQLDANSKRAENAKKGGRPNKKPMDIENEETKKPMVSEVSENKKTMDIENENGSKPNVNVNVNDNVNVNIKESKPKKSTAFQKPTLQEINDYIAEKGYKVDAERFYNHYESNGWMVGKNKMKNWKASLANWNSGKLDYSKPTKFNNYNQRPVTDELATKLLRG